MFRGFRGVTLREHPGTIAGLEVTYWKLPRVNFKSW